MRTFGARHVRNVPRGLPRWFPDQARPRMFLHVHLRNCTPNKSRRGSKVRYDASHSWSAISNLPTGLAGVSKIWRTTLRHEFSKTLCRRRPGVVGKRRRHEDLIVNFNQIFFFYFFSFHFLPPRFSCR